MKSWKIIQKVDTNGAKYYCYRRYWLFFWKLKRVLTPEDYDELCENVNFGGLNVRDLFYHVNF